MNAKKLRAAAEAVLFASGEPIGIKKISEVLEISESETRKVLDDLSAFLDENECGICLLRLADKYQLCTKTEYSDIVRTVIDQKKNVPLSQAALEVLAVVAYNQPITRAFVEQVRGVDCSAVITNLVQKNLLEEKGRMDLPGRPLLYGTTPEFLRCFCISSLSELPEIDKSADENSESNEDSEEVPIIDRT